MTMAAGLAMAGLHPVVSVYATFLNRAFDQLLMDVALHKLPVTVTLDRAGVTGPDGASHNGMWDGSILQVVPGLRVAAPRDGSRVAELLNEAVEVSDGPTVIRWPKGNVGAEVEAVGKLGGMDVLAVPGAGRYRQQWPGRAAARGRPDGRHLRRGRQAAERPRHRRDRRRPALGQAGRPGGHRRGRRAPPGRGGRGQRPGGRLRRRGRAAAARRRRRHPGQDLRPRPGVPHPRDPGADPRGGRADPAAPGPPADRGGRPPRSAAGSARAGVAG